MKTVETYILPEYLHKPDLDKTLKLLKNHKRFKDRFKKLDSFDVEIVFKNKILYIIHFQDGEYKSLTSISKMQSDGVVGIRISNDISKLPDATFLKAMKFYFGQQSDVSLFYKKQDFKYIVANINNDLASSICTSGKEPSVNGNYGYSNLNTSGLWSGSEDKGLSNNALLRSLDENDLPFHEVHLKYADIKKAVNTLSDQFYIYIHAFYFPELPLPANRANVQESYNKLLESKSHNHYNYRRSRKKLNASLMALRRILIYNQKV